MSDVGQDAENRAATVPDLELLREVSRRVLWLSAAIVDAANRGRPNGTGIKVGGHQASSASMVDDHGGTVVPRADQPRPGLGQAARLAGAARDQLPARRPRRRTSRRCARRAACSPTRPGSRTPTRSTSRPARSGSGPPRPLWAAIAHRYVALPVRRRTAGGTIHQPARRRRAGRGRDLGGRRRPAGRQPGRAAVGGRPQPAVAGPGGARHPDRSGCRAMFDAAGWQVVTLKWGRLISRALRSAPAATLLREPARVDAQRGVPADAAGRLLRRRRADPGSATAAPELRALLRVAAAPPTWPRRSAISAGTTSGCSSTPSPRSTTDRPTVVFAYTVKGRGLPTEGHPNNHSALLTDAQMHALAADSGVDLERPRGSGSRRTAPPVGSVRTPRGAAA